MKLSLCVASVLVLCAASFTAGSAYGPEGSVPHTAHASVVGGVQLGQELFDGDFAVYVAGTTHPVGWVWVESQPNGDVSETWLLLRPNATDGWVFPSSTNMSVTLTFEYEGASPHGSVAAFETWAEARYDSALNVDKDVDFEVHTHQVEID